MDPRARLLELLSSLSFRLGSFTLSSGAASDYYIDCRTTTLNAEGARLAGIVLLDLIREHFPAAQAIGGLTLGADPLVSAVAIASAQELADYQEFQELAPEEDHGETPSLLQGFLVRKSEKAHGTGRRIEGFVQPGARVVLVDDVCTTGGSTVQALEAVRAAGMEVCGAVCLVDRQAGGRAHLEAALGEDAPFLAVFTAEDIREFHTSEHRP